MIPTKARDRENHPKKAKAKKSFSIKVNKKSQKKTHHEDRGEREDEAKNSN
jgi:hypothetical protein